MHVVLEPVTVVHSLSVYCHRIAIIILADRPNPPNAGIAVIIFVSFRQARHCIGCWQTFSFMIRRKILKRLIQRQQKHTVIRFCMRDDSFLLVFREMIV